MSIKKLKRRFKKLEREYDRTPKEAALRRDRITKQAAKLQLQIGRERRRQDESSPTSR